ncbi:uncharacterized protein Gasu_21270 [Galdieria sulphuraria]|uniref:Uncharacterized protein n=1 Tax=Galdieria sulphuraria TaxID=130081 RepID=M2X2R0_GALSU|nr:uncharacterized protein Gasu_21270 [Galdieria sulphuraria]EME30670.1 hypothetical protein Gasu_21270 [Galdieria sulphuraria]|eukprot:XP_005707190.1 hypothetical protein Gasu_21270 [Galdieria sulphuraria]
MNYDDYNFFPNYQQPPTEITPPLSRRTNRKQQQPTQLGAIPVKRSEPRQLRRTTTAALPVKRNSAKPKTLKPTPQTKKITQPKKQGTEVSSSKINWTTVLIWISIGVLLLIIIAVAWILQSEISKTNTVSSSVFNNAGYPVVLSPNGPDSEGNFGPNTPGTKTGGLAEAIKYAYDKALSKTSDYGPSVVMLPILVKQGVYEISEPIKLPAPSGSKNTLGFYLVGQPYSVLLASSSFPSGNWMIDCNGYQFTHSVLSGIQFQTVNTGVNGIKASNGKYIGGSMQNHYFQLRFWNFGTDMDLGYNDDSFIEECQFNNTVVVDSPNGQIQFRNCVLGTVLIKNIQQLTITGGLLYVVSVQDSVYYMLQVTDCYWANGVGSIANRLEGSASGASIDILSCKNVLFANGTNENIINTNQLTINTIQMDTVYVAVYSSTSEPADCRIASKVERKKPGNLSFRHWANLSEHNSPNGLS